MEKISFKPTDRSIMSAHRKWYLAVWLGLLEPETQSSATPEPEPAPEPEAEAEDEQ